METEATLAQAVKVMLILCVIIANLSFKHDKKLSSCLIF